MNLNKWELEILKLAKKKEKISQMECSIIYKNNLARRDALMRLVKEGYLDSEVPGIFSWTGKEFSEKPSTKKNIFTIEQQHQIKECLESCEGAELEKTLREITNMR